MTSAADEFADLARIRVITLARVEAGMNRKILRELRRSGRKITAQLAASELTGASGGLTPFARARLQATLAGVEGTIEAMRATNAGIASETLGNVAAHEAAWVKGALDASIHTSSLTVGLAPQMLRTIADETVINGAPSAEWWSRQSRSMRTAFADRMRSGLIQGETNAQLIRAVRGPGGILEKHSRHARTLVRDSVQSVANEARVRMYKENSDVIKGYIYQATLDAKTSEICAALDGLVWDMDQNPIDHGINFQQPPGTTHHNCRSTLLPWLKDWRELGIDADELPKGTRASMDGQVPRDKTYDQFLREKGNAPGGKEFQDKLLGPGKAELFRKGRITTRDLIDQTGRPLTLGEIKENLA